VTVIFQHHDALELNRIDYRGAVSSEELFAHARFRTAAPHWLNYDHLNVILADANAADVTREALSALRLRHDGLFRPENLLILRRSAWVCFSASARPLLRHWLHTRDATAERHTSVRLFDSIEEACGWLVLNVREAALVARSEGFREVQRFHAPPTAAPER